ncbi:hypothetical protein QUF70_04805 [Desulfobacterales bacterium HSG17]|nr:hypothetical protein [Desulfobacterales bacterium HSG17]
MKKLEQEGLFGGGLVPVNTLEMVNRYNACLQDIGIEPTGLDSFSIDGIGWSPEIAAEKKDNFFLSHGGANQFAVILSPAQHNKPIYFPFYSFSRDLMNAVFERHLRQIADITRETAIWLDIDQEISHYLSPLDLLLLDSICIRVYTVNKIMDAAKKQKALIRKFTNDENAWFDLKLRQEIIKSAKKHGDLRFRSVQIPDISFNDTRSFYTMAFDGIYVFRDVLKTEKNMLILENEELVKELGQDIKGVFSLSDRYLFSSLFREGLLTYNLSYYYDNPESLNIKKECIFVNLMAKHFFEVDCTQLNPGQKRGYVRQLQKHLPKEFFDLERLAKQIANKEANYFMNLSYDMSSILMYPNQSLPQPVQNMLWQLITETVPLDIILLYTYNKSKFFELYQTWGQNKKNWAFKMLKEHYGPLNGKSRREDDWRE